MITRCPVCETSFRITEAQLNTAKGAVRCGSCLQIFKALDNLAPPRGTAKKPVEPAAESTQADVPHTPKPRPAMPKFEYKKPAESFALSHPDKLTASVTNNGAAESDHDAPQRPASLELDGLMDSDVQGSSDLSSQEEEGSWQYASGMDGISDQDGQENMLRFDQAAIDDANETVPDDSVFSDDLMISDDMSMDYDGSDTNDEPASKSIFGDDTDEPFLDLDAWKAEEKSLFDRELKPHKRGDEDDNPIDPDESWAIDLLEEDDEAVPPPAPASTKPEFQPELEPFDEENDSAQDDYGNYSRASTGSFGALDDDEIDMFGDADTFGNAKAAHRDESSKAENGDPDQEYGNDWADDDYGYPDDSDRRALLSRIEPEPVEFAFYQRRSWAKKLAWGGMAALGLLLLVAQLAWLQFDSLSRQQPYRDLYASVCPMIGCELPSLAAPDMIRTSNLVVRSHPQSVGALMVDTILLNTASFQQPFPDLVLSFSNIHGEMLATRRFTPGEYLSGELAGRTTMPSNQPVHLSLEIVDPGPDAINYSAYIPQ